MDSCSRWAATAVSFQEAEAASESILAAIANPIAYLVYQIGTLITTGALGAGFLPGLIAVAAIAAVIVCLCKKADKK